MTPLDSGTSEALNPGCSPTSTDLGAQLARDRRLGQHATSTQRKPGEVIVHFADNFPAGVLEYALDVERRCCPFVQADYEEARLQLAVTVETIDRDPRLDSLFYALS